MNQSDYYFSTGLVQPPTSYSHGNETCVPNSRGPVYKEEEVSFTEAANFKFA